MKTEIVWFTIFLAIIFVSLATYNVVKDPDILTDRIVCKSMEAMGYFKWQKEHPGASFFSPTLSKLDNDCNKFIL